MLSHSTSIQFLDIIFYSDRARLELPLEKPLNFREYTERFCQRRKVSKFDLQKLVLHMNFAARAVHGARTFTRIFIDALCFLQILKHNTRMKKLLSAELS